ncbi:hypothetical protein [Spongiibacter sp.]|uniref:hypothetical protein n=1 Tax=Spongiibacter sp. TaxID=2024860 RepID=UPI003565C118
MALIEQSSLFDSPDESLTKPTASGCITEICLSSQAHLSRTLLAAMLMQLSNHSDQRWLCWVADRPLKPLLDANSQYRGQRILQVVANGGSLCRIAARALERGKSHTVAILLNQALSPAEQQLLEDAAQAGNAECLLIRLQD